MTASEIAILKAKQDMITFRKRCEYYTAHDMPEKAQYCADRWTECWLDLLYLEHLDDVISPMREAVYG